nr:hypothetical protein [Angustibacter aerolatus]
MLGFDPEQTFEVSDEVLAHARSVRDRGRERHEQWESDFQAWRSANPERATLLERLSGPTLPDGFEAAFPQFDADPKGVASRAASGKVLDALAPIMPERGAARPTWPRATTPP